MVSRGILGGETDLAGDGGQEEHVQQQILAMAHSIEQVYHERG